MFSVEIFLFLGFFEIFLIFLSSPAHFYCENVVLVRAHILGFFEVFLNFLVPLQGVPDRIHNLVLLVIGVGALGVEMPAGVGVHFVHHFGAEFCGVLLLHVRILEILLFDAGLELLPEQADLAPDLVVDPVHQLLAGPLRVIRRLDLVNKVEVLEPDQGMPVQPARFCIFLAADPPVSLQDLGRHIVGRVENRASFAVQEGPDLATAHGIEPVHVFFAFFPGEPTVQNLLDRKPDDLVEEIDHGRAVLRAHLLHFEGLDVKGLDVGVVEDGLLLLVELHERVLEHQRLELAHRDREEDVRRALLLDHALGELAAPAERLVGAGGSHLRAHHVGQDVLDDLLRLLAERDAEVDVGLVHAVEHERALVLLRDLLLPE